MLHDSIARHPTPEGKMFLGPKEAELGLFNFYLQNGLKSVSFTDFTLLGSSHVKLCISQCPGISEVLIAN